MTGWWTWLRGSGGERASVCVVELKSGDGASSTGDLHFYALLETLRSGAAALSDRHLLHPYR